MKSRILFCAMMSAIAASIAAVSLVSFAAYAQSPAGYSSTAPTAAANTPAYLNNASPAQAPHPNSGYYSSQSQTGNPGYYSGNGASTTTYSKVPHRPRHKTVIIPEFSVGVFTGSTYFVPTHALPPGPVWVNMRYGIPLPPNVVIGGGDHNQVYYVCRANFQGGKHPGKLVAGKCNISYGGQEIAVTHYQVLLSHIPLAWSGGSYGFLPPYSLRGGYESNGKPLYICQAQFNGGTYPGKLVGRRCNIAWEGREIAIPYYNVLVD